MLAQQHPEADFIWAEVSIIDEIGNVTKPGIRSCRNELITPSRAAWEHVLKVGTIWTISGSFSKTCSLLDSPFDANYPHCADWDFVLTNLLKSTFLYHEFPLTQIRIHSSQQSAVNLANFTDLDERNCVIAKQLSAHQAGLLLRLSLMYKVLKSCFIRSLVNVKRGQLSPIRFFRLVKISLKGIAASCSSA